MYKFKLTLAHVPVCLKVIKFALSIYAFFVPKYALYAEGAKIAISIAIDVLEVWTTE